MDLTAKNVAQMIDLSCVQTISNKADIQVMVDAARDHGFGHVSVLQCFIPYTRELLRSAPETGLVGNVSFPSGSDSTSLKIAQAKELVAAGCDEIDVVMNIGELCSGEIEAVEADVQAVIEAARPLPVKVIIEVMYLSDEQVEQACGICLRAGAAFVKTGTGWANRGTTVEHVRLVKSLIGDKVQIKASGGIRSLKTLEEMYAAGARRFGVNMKSGIAIVEECIIHGTGTNI